MNSKTPGGVPEAFRSDTAWRAVLHVFETAFSDDPRVWEFVTEGGIDFPAMIDRGAWSGGERTLLRAAAALFDAENTISLWKVAKRLDRNCWMVFLDALTILRGGSQEVK